MIGYRDTLYIFGGEVGFSNGVETPLWTYNITVRRSIHNIFILSIVKSHVFKVLSEIGILEIISAEKLKQSDTKHLIQLFRKISAIFLHSFQT